MYEITSPAAQKNQKERVYILAAGVVEVYVVWVKHPGDRFAAVPAQLA